MRCRNTLRRPAAEGTRARGPGRPTVSRRGPAHGRCPRSASWCGATSDRPRRLRPRRAAGMPPLDRPEDADRERRCVQREDRDGRNRQPADRRPENAGRLAGPEPAKGCPPARHALALLRAEDHPSSCRNLVSESIRRVIAPSQRPRRWIVRMRSADFTIVFIRTRASARAARSMSSPVRSFDRLGTGLRVTEIAMCVADDGGTRPREASHLHCPPTS